MIRERTIRLIEVAVLLMATAGTLGTKFLRMRRLLIVFVLLTLMIVVGVLIVTVIERARSKKGGPQ